VEEDVERERKIQSEILPPHTEREIEREKQTDRQRYRERTKMTKTK